MGSHRSNPVAVANAAPRRDVRAIDIGEGYGVFGVTVEPAISVASDEQQPELAIVLTVVAGRRSDLVPSIPVKLILGELGKVSLVELRRRIAAAIDGPPKEQAPE